MKELSVDVLDIIIVFLLGKLLYNVVEVIVESFFFYCSFKIILFEIIVYLFDWFFFYLLLSKEVFLKNL